MAAPGRNDLVSGLPMPRVYVCPQETPNAFATGRNPQNAVVAVTQGLLKRLDRFELMGVIGHELAHIKHRDILISSIAAVMAGAISYLATMAQWAMIFGGRGNSDRGGNPLVMLIMMIVAPLAASLIQMAISRKREYLADANGALLTRYPQGLADARELQRLEGGTQLRQSLRVGIGDLQRDCGRTVKLLLMPKQHCLLTELDGAGLSTDLDHPLRRR